MRVGIGYDVHKLVEGRPLILGGVNIPFAFGLEGHSDADALVHAIMDAVLGAAGAGDIGKHFPDTDQRYKGISSLVLLKKVMDHVNSMSWEVGNVDAVIIAQNPKLSPYIKEMERNLCQAMHVEPGTVNIKATTTERLGFEGLGEGLAAQAVALLYRSK